MKTKRQEKKKFDPYSVEYIYFFCHFLTAFYRIFLQSVNNLIKFNDILQRLIYSTFQGFYDIKVREDGSKREEKNKCRSDALWRKLGQITSIVYALLMKFGNMWILGKYITQELSP